MSLPDWFDWQAPDYERVFAERAERLQRIRDTPGMLAGLLDHYKDNPADWISDWGMTTDPRNAEIGLPVVVPFLLFPRQREFCEWLVRRWRGREDGLIEKSRDMGLSWLCVALAVWMWRFHPETVIGFGSRKEEYVDKIGDPKSLFWKARQFINLLPAEFRPAGYVEDKHAPHMRIINPENGATIIGEAGDNIGRGNRTSIYFKDEAAFYERPEAIDAALSQTSNCKIDVSTPNGAGNPFYRKRFGGRIAVFVFDWRDDPRKGDAWYAKQCQTINNPIVVAQEIDRNYEASVVNALIDGDYVTAAMQRGAADVAAIGGIRVGVDPARFGDDKFAVTVRRGRVVLLQEETQYLDSIQGAVFVKNIVQPYNNELEQIAVDEIGIGAGVVDQLKVWFGELVIGINSALRMDGEFGEERRSLISTKTLYFNIRSMMYGELKEWVQSEVSLPMDHDLKAELTAIRYSYRGGSLILESKEDMKKRGIKSPNKADSLALTFADPRSNRRLTDYDVIRNPALAAGRTPASRAGY